MTHINDTDTTPFYALTEGQIPSPFPDENGLAHDYITLRVVPLGELKITSGTLEANDPFVTLAQSQAIPVPNGTFPVYVTTADVSAEHDQSHEREAYLSVVFTEGTINHIRQIHDTDGEEVFVVVDAGIVGLCDYEAARTLMPHDTNWYEEIFMDGIPGSWFDQMDSPQHYEAGMANIIFPLATAGENIALCHSGWGDGYYGVKGAYDANGTLLSIHIDLEVATDTEDNDCE